MARINRALGYRENKSFLKHVSYVGAIRVPDAFPDKEISWRDPDTGERYLDPGNAVYCAAFRSVWDQVIPERNQKTIGDLIEAMLGWAWTKRVRHGELDSPLCEAFLKWLETLILVQYTLWEWYRR